MLALTSPGDWVFDPFLGTGTAIVAAVIHDRNGMGAEIVPKYVELARSRIEQALQGTLKTRPMGKPVYDPVLAGNSLTVAPWHIDSPLPTHQAGQLVLLDNPVKRYGAE